MDLPAEVRAQAEASAEACRRLDGLPRSRARSGPYDPPVAPSVSQTISFFEQGGKEENWDSILQDVKERPAANSALQRLALERDVRHLEEQVQLGAEEGRRQRDEGGEPLLKASRVDGGSADQVDVEAGVSSLAPRVAEAKMALEAWALSLAATPAEVERMKKVIEDFDADAQQLERERGHRAGPEPGARGEIYLKDMTPTEVRLTVPALIKALEIHFEYKAVEPVAIDQVVPKEATLRSRFVIVNKKWLQREFGPKGRLCVGGHLDPQAGEYETSSPTAQLLGHHILLVVTVASPFPVRNHSLSGCLRGHRQR